MPVSLAIPESDSVWPCLSTAINEAEKIGHCIVNQEFIDRHGFKQKDYTVWYLSMLGHLKKVMRSRFIKIGGSEEFALCINRRSIIGFYDITIDPSTQLFRIAKPG